jgi:hypothetical protein
MINDTKKKNQELSARQALKKANVVDRRLQKHFLEVKQLELKLEKKKEAVELLQEEYNIYIKLASDKPFHIEPKAYVKKDEK